MEHEPNRKTEPERADAAREVVVTRNREPLPKPWRRPKPWERHDWAARVATFRADGDARRGLIALSHRDLALLHARSTIAAARAGIAPAQVGAFATDVRHALGRRLMARPNETADDARRHVLADQARRWSA